MAERLQRCQDDHCAARSSDPPLRHHRDRKRQVALQKPNRRSHHNPRSRRLRNPDQLRRRERYRPTSSFAREGWGLKKNHFFLGGFSSQPWPVRDSPARTICEPVLRSLRPGIHSRQPTAVREIQSWDVRHGAERALVTLPKWERGAQVRRLLQPPCGPMHRSRKCRDLFLSATLARRKFGNWQ
jgi:hypothetical protein